MIAEDIQLTTDEKLAIIQDIMDEIHAKSGILAIHSEDFLTGRSTSSPIHTYQVAGSQFQRKTQTSNLQQKVLQAHETALRIQQENDRLEKVEEQQEEEQVQKEGYRYYKSNVRCFRCKKVGHHNYACPQKTKCLYCLDESHQADKCPQKTVCYQCYHWGHIISECHSPQSYFCQTCKRRHSGTCSFLTRGTEPIKQLFSKDYIATDPLIRCMRCFKYGHLVCEKDEN